jgi:hypothetical protein
MGTGTATEKQRSKSFEEWRVSMHAILQEQN